MKRLYITDLDGTLLDNNGVLSDYSKKTIKRIIASGVSFTVASARSVQSIRRILQGIELKLPIVAFNGAYVSDFKTGKHHIVNKICNIGMFELLKGYGVLVSLHKKGIDTLSYAGDVSLGTRKYIQDREKELEVNVSALNDLPANSDVMAFTVIDTKERIESLQKQLLVYDDIIVDAWEDMYYKPWYWLSIHSSKATKAKGIQSLRLLLENDMEELVVFGDNTNDLEMFKDCDIAIAVENAVTSLKQHADIIIGKNTEDSVVQKICQMENLMIDSIGI